MKHIPERLKTRPKHEKKYYVLPTQRTIIYCASSRSAWSELRKFFGIPAYADQELCRLEDAIYESGDYDGYLVDRDWCEDSIRGKRYRQLTVKDNHFFPVLSVRYPA